MASPLKNQNKSPNRAQSVGIKGYDEKIREFYIEKDTYVRNGRAKLFTEYVTLGSKTTFNAPPGTKSGLTYQLSIYVLLKKEKKQQSKPKRLNTYGKSQM